MSLLVAFFVLAIVVVGIGVTLFADVEMRAEERVLHGVVVGVVIVSVVGFAMAWIGGATTRASVIASTLLALGLTGSGWRRDPERIVHEWTDLGRRFRLGPRHPDSPWPVVLITLFSAIVSIRILGLAYGSTIDGGVSVGHLSTFGDWSAHLAYAGSFAYSENFPPELPSAAGESFVYHFGIDWFSAMFVPLGVSLQGSLQLSSGILAVAFPGAMYLAGVRIVRRRLAAALAVLVFLASGGTAALYRFLFEDLIDGGIGVLFDLPRTYAFDGFDRNWVDNAVTGFLYPQRPTQIGFAIVLAVLAWLLQARDTPGVRTHAVTGVLTGLMPGFHVFAFGVLVVMAAWWTVLERTRRWIWFWVPTLVLGIPVLIWQLPPDGSSGRELHFFWMLGKSSWEPNLGDFVWFWFLNTGLFIPLALLGYWRWRDDGLRFLPILGLLLLPNIAIWHFWPGNNVKYLIFFILIGALFVGRVLAQWIDRGGLLRLGAILALVTLTLSGGLDIWQAFEGSAGAYPAAYLSADDVLVGEWVRDRTPPKAVFATANGNTHPVPAIAGRTVVSGAAGRLNDLGVDWVTREQDLRTLYGVNEGFDVVIAKYDIDYLVLGPEERRLFRPVDAPADWDPAIFWDAAAPVVYDIGGYKVYDVRAYQQAEG